MYAYDGLYLSSVHLGLSLSSVCPLFLKKKNLTLFFTYTIILPTPRHDIC